MNWYYVDAGQQAGPVDDGQLEELLKAGKIQADTLIWSEGMANWQPYQEVKSPGLAMPPPPTAAGAAPVAVAGPITGNEAVCAECGGMFNKQDMIQYSGAYVCARCKPVFMQKLAEGAKINTGRVTYAGFWIRFGAKFVDGLIMRVAGFPISLIFGAAAPMTSRSVSGAVALPLLGALIGFLIGMAYNVFFLGKFGATPGKMACKIKVVMADGTPISYGRAFGRFWAEMVSGCLTLTIGYIMAGFDEQKRSLHDRICNTRVIYK
jgi:uncharacterized RDD family membrane protein YckC